MTVRHLLLAPALLLALALAPALAVASCTTTAETIAFDDGGIPTRGMASVSIASPAMGDCVVVPDGADPRLPVQLTLHGLFLRPPGYCGIIGNDGCGRVVLQVNGEDNNEGSSSVVEVLLRKLGDRYTTLAITVQVVDDVGAPLFATGNDGTSPDGGTPLNASVTVKTVKTAAECPSN